MNRFFRRCGNWPVALCCMAAALIFAVSGCKSRQKTLTPVVKEERKPEDRTVPDLQQLIADHAFKARTITAKASVRFAGGNQDNTFNINLRLYTDSAIWISITPLLGIEVARVLVTRDSVKFLDRLNKKYSVSDFKMLNEVLEVSVDFDIIQGILTGNLFAYKKNKFNSVYLEDRYYILSTLSKRKLKRSLEDMDVSKPIVQDLWVEDTNYRITRLSVEDQKLQKSLLTDYSDHRQTEGGLFPFKSKTVIKAGKTLNIDIEYQKLSLNNDIDFPFTISSNYERIE